PWILHDGPPYANGELHMGHFLNMVLKDMFVKIALLEGREARFIPGWDMHGLPIELDTLKHLGIKDFHQIDPLELRAQCKARALHWLERQAETRERMGVFAEFANPYRTIDASFEATIVETLAELVEREQLYRGLRATLWCIHDETALAEAEIEYETKLSPSLYVRFPAIAEQRSALLGAFHHTLEPRVPLSILIWTTTPWTLPANVAIALRADAEYGLYRVGEELLVVAVALASRALGESYESAKLLATTSGASLDGLKLSHPFAERSSLLVLADYVDLETGTGAVHTAPGHGADDFATGVKYDLPILSPVDAAGRFTAEAGAYRGLQVFEANQRIIEDLRERGALWRLESYEHSYPHCWRCHNPVIFRATAQWFIAMDQNRLRARAIEALQSVRFEPEWGRARLVQMLENHPEWCISRQRTWGTPIPALLCKGCNESILDARVVRIAAARFREVGADAWWSEPVEGFLPEAYSCPHCGAREFEKERNIVDIWFESGVTHRAVLGNDPRLPWPSDLVLEGGDQYRGWFRSSLLTAVATKGAAPYRCVVKNGWVNDEQGRPMSKSRGTGIDAREAMSTYGADVLRLWAASVEFIDDVRFGPSVVEQVARVYRNLRNRVRFLLGNLADLNPDAIVEREKMEPFDRLACNITDAFVAKVRGEYAAFGIHDAYLSIVAFESTMSGLAFDALKDPLYSGARDGARRRSAQSALFHILRGLLTVLAPLLPFTAEEAWQALPTSLRGDRESVFSLRFDGEPREWRQRDEVIWEQLRDLRAEVAASASPRDFEARVELHVGSELYDELTALGENLREALIVSELDLHRNGAPETASRLILHRASGEKCARCWKFRPLLGSGTSGRICAPCTAIVTN
ncbi:MAG TPA: isoleucine--tRNA ligase, partial [Candidatus Dormibacteraeota bacterium]|nr:isoleucine--tRNA ligase [Candidatus Dormibacteraeota bacterium]